MKLADQLPFVDASVKFLAAAMIIRRTIVPDSSRIAVKLDASMALFPNAKRHSTELAANAINANPVRIIVFNNEFLIITNPSCMGNAFVKPPILIISSVTSFAAIYLKLF